MFMNYNDGYYLTVPDEWVEKVYISTDVASKTTTFYQMAPIVLENNLETDGNKVSSPYFDKLLQIKAVTQNEWEWMQQEGYQKITEKDGTVYVALVSEQKSLAMSISQLQQNFTLIAG